MKLIFKEPEQISFRDVPINSFYKDYQQDLMLKIDSVQAVRIARSNGIVNTELFRPSENTTVEVIFNVEHIEF